ncbi:methenyltetrahydrofolate cyclohydrolase [Methylococcus sp. EFPC2]|uniref:methenyltetrahydrofolate cyclohydrolase n=1 Tax=Methylococcus sp. EFPC2 TaxID=2812648 RepID=UPI0019674E65|nr:methenyltetrahydrofolate cyclohydrolase [Methylococcus sp. EFPC2]QSA97693.1 cyclodeaminase/cyclohydrolase family protein [Methylococcus sp. EFPC2]
MLKDRPIQQFLDELASKAPTPGGGGAAAIMGAMGASLVAMVCNLTLGKKAYEAVEDDIKAALQASEALRARLTDMIRADAEAFDLVMGAYGLPKESDEEKAARSAAIQDALKVATDVPLACAKACAEVIELSRAVAEKGNKNVVSDAGVAVLAGYAALKSAALNVYVNTNAIRDEHFVHERISELNAILTGMEVAMEEIYQEVKSRL